VYTADQITDGRVHGVMHRGDHAEISTYIEKAIDNDFSGNVIDVCPVGALTDKTYRFKSRVWFSKPMDAHCSCDKCSGNVTLWYRGDEVIRVTGRKNEWGELKEFICNTCRFDRKKTSDWTIEGPTNVSRHSVISANKYGAGLIKPAFPIAQAARDYKLIEDDRDRSFLTNQASLPAKK
jgi:NADH-quinone oxidoreductase subunit G